MWSALLPVNFEQLFIDANDNVLAVGEFSSTFDLDPGLGVTLVDAADGEMLVVEYAPNGTVNWYTQFAQTVPGSWGLRVADIEKDQNDPGPGRTGSVPATTVMRGLVLHEDDHHGQRFNGCCGRLHL
ncbi:MAG: hypothetical protein IPI07_19185 [Flavobacteriales bacterium]|nr:hypothetical protein [Flavobacteriales bacterium]